MIRNGVIVTAAHCVQSFNSGSVMYTNHKFYPGHYGATGATAAQMAPYGAWTAGFAVTPASWKNGTDPGCGAARDNDLAVIAIKKMHRENSLAKLLVRFLTDGIAIPLYRVL